MDERDPITFAKMAGAGNDFVVIDNEAGLIEDAADLARRICTRALSVGADGLILLEPSANASFRMRYYNSDGSLGEFCGNGTRCAARFAVLEGIAEAAMTIETDAGIVEADALEGGQVSISLPPPADFRAERPVKVGETEVHGSSITVGVPHYVVFVREDLWKQDIVPLGSSIRYHPELQPKGANVNFVLVRDEHSIEVRTYERGVEAETLACGSGVVASVSVSTLFGLVKPPVRVLTRSGITLEVSMTNVNGTLRDVKLKGDARVVFRGTMTQETLAGFDPDWARDPTRTPAAT